MAADDSGVRSMRLDSSPPPDYATASFLRHCLNLLNHAGQASDTAGQLVAEIQSWGQVSTGRWPPAAAS